MDPVLAAGVDTFLHWLGVEQGASFRPVADSEPLIAECNGQRLGIAVRPLFDTASDLGWVRRCQAVAAQLGEAGAAPLSLWIPPQTDLPHGDRSDFIRCVTAAAAALGRGERGQVEFPVTLTLRKLSDEASYVHVTGGLAPHWARLTGRAFGQYELDARAIHRLPEPESRIGELLDWVVLLGNGMKAGTSSTVEAVDAWTIRRPLHGDWVAVIGADPASDPSNGTSVRKLMRQALVSARQELQAGLPTALVVVGIYPSLGAENATIALRSCDPALSSGFDAVALVADGLCKPLLGPRPSLGGRRSEAL